MIKSALASGRPSSKISSFLPNIKPQPFHRPPMPRCTTRSKDSTTSARACSRSRSGRRILWPRKGAAFGAERVRIGKKWKLGTCKVGKRTISLVRRTGQIPNSKPSFPRMPRASTTLNWPITRPIETAIKCFSCVPSQRPSRIRPRTFPAALQPQLSRSLTPFPRLASSRLNRANLNAKNCPPSIKQTLPRAHKSLTWTSASLSPTLNSTTSTLFSSSRNATNIISLQALFSSRITTNPCSRPSEASC